MGSVCIQATFFIFSNLFRIMFSSGFIPKSCSQHTNYQWTTGNCLCFLNTQRPVKTSIGQLKWNRPVDTEYQRLTGHFGVCLFFFFWGAHLQGLNLWKRSSRRGSYTVLKNADIKCAHTWRLKPVWQTRTSSTCIIWRKDETRNPKKNGHHMVFGKI